jgi:uncharacterized coiled-coil protein SlyX
MTSVDLTVHVQQLDQRLAEVESTLLRLEQLLVSIQTTLADEQTHILAPLPRRVRFISPRLRHRGQAADFAMQVTREV